VINSREQMVTKLKIMGSAVLAAIFAGCAAGPNYHPPQTQVAAGFGRVGEGQYATNTPLVQWWTSFNDPLLVRLVETALTNNYDLRIAAANLHEARALRRQSQFDLLPVPQATAGYTKEQLSPAAFPGITQPLRASFFDAGFDAFWELDFFGRVRRTVEARSATMEASEASLEAVRISLTSEIARNYFELRGLQNELKVALKNSANQKQTVDITRARLEGGRGTQLDVARARVQYSSTLSFIPPLETAIAEAIHRLGVLTGQQPTALQPELTLEGSLPSLPSVVNIGDPRELLRRRPDVRIAERNLAAATASIGVAVADLYPRVTFNGQFGWEAAAFSSLGTASSETWSFGPRITWAALDLGHVRARIEAAHARADSTLAQYERTVLGSLEETENSLVVFGREQQRLKYLQDAVVDSRTASELARQRYDAGAVDFLVVLDAERAQLLAEDQLAQSQTRTATALVAVFKALGGN
jgi:multidrug efflux system outer membrane protein